MSARPIVVALALAAGAASGQTLTAAKVEPALGVVGQNVTLTATLQSPNGAQNCNLLVHWGDGAQQHFHVNQEKDMTFTLTHAYKAPGSYEVKVEPKTKLPVPKCLGGNQVAAVKVQEGRMRKPPAPDRATALSAQPRGGAKADPRCPPGWELDRKSLSKKHAGFTCRAAPGTAAPSPPPACEGDLTYFHNARRGQLGCRP